METGEEGEAASAEAVVVVTRLWLLLLLFSAGLEEGGEEAVANLKK